MRLKNTTSPIVSRRHLTIFNEQETTATALQSRALSFEIIELYFSECGPSWSSSGRGESDCFHHINLVVKSDASVVHDGKRLLLKPGHAYFFPADTPVERQFKTRYETFWLRFRCSWVSQLDPLLNWLDRHPIELGEWDPQEWNGMLDEKEVLKARMILLWQARLTEWFAQHIPDLDTIFYGQERIHSEFARVFELIESRLSADLRLENLAEAYGASVQTFSRRFTKALRQNPKTYLNARLNQRAVQRVLRTSLTMKEIAAELRFSDEYYFSRFFRKMNGDSPSRYRQSVDHRRASLPLALKSAGS